MLYQLVNRWGQPASYDDQINPDALFTSEEDAKRYREFLYNQCGVDTIGYKIVPYQTELNDRAVLVYNLMVGAELKDPIMHVEVVKALMELERVLDFRVIEE